MFDQLKYEEMLLRHSKENWCLVSSGPHRPHIVLGLSGKVDKLVHVPRVARDDIPMIRRFSGGGTVIVDSSTVFVTFIVNAKDAQTAPYPRDIMRWTEGVYGPVFRDLQADSEFRLRENDYVFGDRKIGGNAQAIIKDRWLHHTSFLWDFSESNMAYLAMPSKRPEYRGDRQHGSFLTALHRHLPPQCRPSDLRLALRRRLATMFSVSGPDSDRPGDDSEELLREVGRAQYEPFACRSSVELPGPYLAALEQGGGGDSGGDVCEGELSTGVGVGAGVGPSTDSKMRSPPPTPAPHPVGVPSLIRSGPSCFNI